MLFCRLFLDIGKVKGWNRMDVFNLGWEEVCRKISSKRFYIKFLRDKKILGLCEVVI